MKKFLFIFLLLFSFTFAEDICFSKNPSNSSIILENDCMEQLNAICSCEENVCEVVPNEELLIKCIGTNCAINFMSFNEQVQVPIVNVGVFEYLCSSMVGSKCTCYDVSGTIRCDIEKATVIFTYEEDGVSLKLSEYSKKMEYCAENNENEVVEEEELIEEEIVEEEEIETNEQENKIEQNSTCCGGMGLILLLLSIAFYVKN